MCNALFEDLFLYKDKICCAVYSSFFILKTSKKQIFINSLDIQGFTLRTSNIKPIGWHIFNR